MTARLSRRGLLRRLISVAALPLAACGGAPPTPTRVSVAPPTPTPQARLAIPSPTPSPIPAATAIAAEGRPAQFTFALDSDPGSLDLQTQTAGVVADALDPVYETLTQFNEKLDVDYLLATKVERTREANAFVFHLEPTARFHDGKEMTAEDVKWTFDRLTHPETKSVWATSWFEPIQAVAVVDQRTVRFDLSRPYPQLPAVMASLRGGAIARRDSDPRTGAVGTGPFKLKQYAPGERLTYERNPDYRRREEPKLDRIVGRILAGEDARVAALRSGAIDLAPLGLDGVQKLAGASDVRVLGTPSAWIANLTFPYEKFPQFKDGRVRRAFSLVTDREDMIKRSVLGAGTLTGNVPIGFGDWGVPDAELRPLIQRNVEEAKKLLAEAGFPNGQNFPKVRLMASPQFPEFVSNAQILQSNLRELGLDFELLLLEWGAYVAASIKGDVELGFGATTFYPDPDLYLWPQAHSRSENGQRGFRHRAQDELDRLLDQVRSWMGPREERRDLVRRIDKMLLEDPPVVPLYARHTLEGVSSRVKGYTPSFTGRRAGFRTVTLG